MRPLLQRLRLEIAAPAALALTIFVIACGSSSPAGLREAGHSLRWVALGALLLIAAAYALARPNAPHVRVWPLLPAVWLTALAAVSTAWSVQPRLTFERAVSLAIVVAVACLLAYATADDPVARRRLIQGLVAGGALIAVGGVVLLGIDRELATVGNQHGTRYQGLGENPNTVALLAALASPAAAWCALEARGRASRALAWTSFAAIFGSLVAAQSRGAIAGVGAGLLLLTLLPRPRVVRLALTGGIVVLLLFAAQLSSLRFTSITTTARQTPAPAQPPQSGSAGDAQGPDLMQFPVAREEDLGHPFYSRRDIDLGVISSAGRVEAWRGAFHTAMSRPLVGYGFGTEDRVFVDRYYVFEGARPENSYLGWLLQLGATGLAAFALFAASLLGVLIRVVRTASPAERSVAVGLGAITMSGLVAALTQSYLYSAGNVAMLTFWVGAAALALSVRSTRG